MISLALLVVFTVFAIITQSVSLIAGMNGRALKHPWILYTLWFWVAVFVVFTIATRGAY